MDTQLKGKKVVVYAASKGLGKATALSFAMEGCKVAICSGNTKNIEKSATEIQNETKSEVLPYTVDVSQSDQIRNFLSDVLDKWKVVDILVTNTGGPPVRTFQETNSEEWFYCFNSILRSVIESARQVLPPMVNQKWGSIISIASLSVKQPHPGLIYSNTLRPALAGFLKTLSQEYGKYNIHFHCVCPGFFKTEGLERIVKKRMESGENPDAIYDSWKNDVPLGKIGEPEDLASLIVFLASRSADYMNGNIIQVDGGRYAALF